MRTYASVDGGMSDLLRPMLYGAVYEPLLANRADAEPTETLRLVGKHCESGDVLVSEASLPPVGPGDLVCLPATGAYGVAMASNYNGVTRPAVAFVDGGARPHRDPARDLRRPRGAGRVIGARAPGPGRRSASACWAAGPSARPSCAPSSTAPTPSSGPPGHRLEVGPVLVRDPARERAGDRPGAAHRPTPRGCSTTPRWRSSSR